MNKQFQGFKKRASQLALAVTLAGATAVGANAATTTGVTSTAVNMRTGASTKYKIITTIKADQKVSIIGQSGNWYKVEYNGKTGYVYNAYVVKAPTYKVDESVVGKLTAKSGLNVRKGPGLSYTKVGYFHRGETATVTGKASTGWYQIKLSDGTTGYVSGKDKYVTFTADAGENEFEVTPYSGKVKDVTGANIRKGPGLNYDKVGYFNSGDVLEATGKVINKETGKPWYQVKLSDGTTGYVTGLSKYVVPYEEETPVTPETNEAPKIDVVSTYELVKGEDFNYSMLKATATDKEDGNLTDKIDYSGVVNTGEVGEYKVKLTVKDSKGASGTKEVRVLVKKPEATTNGPAIAVDGVYTVKQNSTFNYSDLKATAFDKEDGEVKIDYAGTVDTKTVGEYKVTLTAKDSDGNKTEKTVIVKVVRNVPPTITVSKSSVNVVKGDKFDLSQLGVKATDNEDGDITSKVEYTIYKGTTKVDAVDTSTVGNSYKIIINVKDSDGAKAEEKYATVTIEDNERPEIKFDKTTMKVEQGDTLSQADFVKYINPKATDKEDGDITSKIRVVYFDDVDTNKLGSQKVVFQVTDSHNKGQIRTAYVNVVENKAPEITFTNNDVVGNEIQIKQDDKFDASLLGAKAIDTNQATGKETECKVEVVKSTVDTSVPGTYTVILSAKDAKGAETKATVNVVVKDFKDNQKPVVTLGNKDIKDTAEGKVLQVKLGSKFDASKLEATAKDAEDGDLTSKIVYSGVDDVDTAVLDGTYTVKASVKDSQGATATQEITIVIVK